MMVSVCLTVKNEEKTIAKLLNSLYAQKKRADEIVIVDSDSSDKTVEIIRHFQKRKGKLKFIVESCSRAEGRNLAVEIARNHIIAMTDAGCVAKKYWLKSLTEPFRNEKVDIVAGYYEMKAENAFQKAESVFLGVLPEDYDITFLPSTRSIAFRKKAWEKIGGFPENLKDTAEDTVFNQKALEAGLRIARVKNARVEWGMPETVGEFFNKIFSYAKGDLRSGIWKHSSKGYMSHNVRSLMVVSRYLMGLVLISLSFNYNWLLLVIVFLVLSYVFWSYFKVLHKTRSWKVGLWGIFLQLVSDLAVIKGLLSGVLILRK